MMMSCPTLSAKISGSYKIFFSAALLKSEGMEDFFEMFARRYIVWIPHHTVLVWDGMGRSMCG
jgi:hypothetical protein